VPMPRGKLPPKLPHPPACYPSFSAVCSSARASQSSPARPKPPGRYRRRPGQCTIPAWITMRSTNDAPGACSRGSISRRQVSGHPVRVTDSLTRNPSRRLAQPDAVRRRSRKAAGRDAACSSTHWVGNSDVAGAGKYRPIEPHTGENCEQGPKPFMLDRQASGKASYGH
jgi:hypothetical protein